MAPTMVQAATLSLLITISFAFPNDAISPQKRALAVPTTGLPGNWSSVGCYTEAGATGPSRTLVMAAYSNETAMTDESCIAFCDGQGFNFAGTQYSSQCYCDNIISSGATNVSITECNMACAGNAAEACGGPNRLNVFWNGKKPPAAPSTNPGPPLWTLLGCYTEGAGERALANGPLGTTGGSTKLTVALCTFACNAAGYIFAGVEYAQECYCANTLAKTALLVPLSDCNMLCAGNGSEYCGAGSRLDIYKLSASISTSDIPSTVTPIPTKSRSSNVVSSSVSSSIISSTATTLPTLSSTFSTKISTSSAVSTSTKTSISATASSATYQFIGCYTEATGTRALTGGAYFDYVGMTIEMCQGLCGPTFTMYGLEYGGECYCGNALQAGSVAAPAGDCFMACPGNAAKVCGAGNRLSVYKLGGLGPEPTSGISTTTSSVTGSTKVTVATTSTTTSPVQTGLPAVWKYGGCYIDGVNGRILNYGQPGGTTNTIESCIQTCKGLGYTVAGMEYSSECYCDNHLYNGAAPTAESDCNIPCAGNPVEMCGAGGRMSIYYTGNLTSYRAPATQTTGLPGNWQYAGCYSDNVNGKRALFWQIILTNTNSATNCLSKCSEYGYMAAGMEYGNECYCGDADVLIESGSTLQPEANCAVLCSGDSNYICGGGSRLSYYKWGGAPLHVFNKPKGNLAGQYQFLIGGVIVPLITTLGVNGKVTFLEKYGTGAPNATGAYELDLAKINNSSMAWREMHVSSDIFCSAGLTLPDKVGRQINIGGWNGEALYGIRLYWPDGSPGTPGVNDWQEDFRNLQLQAPRWYPSAIIMANGSILVVGGEIGSNSAPTPSLEILPKPPGGTALYMDWLARTDPNNLYPFCFVLPSGGIFVGYYNEARILNEVTFATVKTLPNMPGSVSNPLAGRTYPLEGTGVLLPQHAPYTEPLTVMMCGGSANGASLAVDNCVSTQPEAANPQWVIEIMPSQRVMSCITALPDGTYLILNGATKGVAGFGLAENPNLGAVLYDPTKPINQRMSVMANTIVPRLYHSEAILLADGRVLVSGSNPQDGIHPDEYRVEVFLPPYLLSGLARPTYSITNKDWSYGQTITITVTRGAIDNIKVSLLAAVSSTHGNSMGQRTIFPAFSCAGTTCTITAPPNSHVSPPGWWQLFILDGPTPSNSTWVRIGGDPANLGAWPKLPTFNVPGSG